METDDRSELLARLARLSAVDATQRHLADRLCEAGRIIVGADGAWILVRSGDGQSVRLSSTGTTATALADIQEVVGEGPCWDAFSDGAAATARVTGRPADRWPAFHRSAGERVGRLTVHAYPMRPGGQTFGVLSFHVRPDADRIASDEAQLLADVIGAALLREPVSPIESDTGGIWSARAEVHQATGMIIAQLGVPADDALALLRAHAYAHETTLTDIAHQVVIRRLSFEGEL